MAISYV